MYLSLVANFEMKYSNILSFKCKLNGLGKTINQKLSEHSLFLDDNTMVIQPGLLCKLINIIEWLLITHACEINCENVDLFNELVVLPS